MFVLNIFHIAKLRGCQYETPCRLPARHHNLFLAMLVSHEARQRTAMERRQLFSAEKSEFSLPIIRTRRYILSQSGGGTDSGRWKNFMRRIPRLSNRVELEQPSADFSRNSPPWTNCIMFDWIFIVLTLAIDALQHVITVCAAKGRHNAWPDSPGSTYVAM